MAKLTPRDQTGHFISRDCPNPDCVGRLQYERDGFWRCDGLIDPDNPHLELQACPFVHFDGDRPND